MRDGCDADGGELGALVDLVRALDTGHAAAVAITDRIELDRFAQARAGLSIEGLLAFRSRMTFGDRRTLVTVAEGLRTLPHLRHAFQTGVVGWAHIRAIVCRSTTVVGRSSDRIRFSIR